MLLATASLCPILLTGAAPEPIATATWQGSMQTSGEPHRVVLQMAKTSNGSWEAKNLYLEFTHDDIHIDSTTEGGAHLRFTANKGNASFDGTFTANGDVIDGIWHAGKTATPNELKRVDGTQRWKVPFEYQYHLRDTTYLPPSADEPKASFSAPQALTYVEQGALAWTAEWQCVAYHTNGSYMVFRPMLTSQFGPPQKKLRDYFITALREQGIRDLEDPHLQPEPTQVVYIAAGLAIWDSHVTHPLSSEIVAALELMFRLQRPTGDWYIDDDNNPPLEANTFQLATVAARAVANVPGWRERQKGASIEAHIQLLENLLRTGKKVRGDYDRTDLLWTAAEYPGLIEAMRMQQLTQMVLEHQQADGEWSIRTFARPEEWGKGNSADKLRVEPELQNPPSDGHMTGLAIIALRKAGVPARDAHTQRGVAWLTANQRASGRWYILSLNRDGRQFITYSGTAYPCWHSRFVTPSTPTQRKASEQTTWIPQHRLLRCYTLHRSALGVRCVTLTLRW